MTIQRSWLVVLKKKHRMPLVHKGIRNFIPNSIRFRLTVIRWVVVTHLKVGKGRK